MPGTAQVFGFNRRVYVSQAKETIYNTAATLTHFFNLLPGSKLRGNWNVFKRSAEATGKEHEGRVIPIVADLRGTLVMNASVEALAYWFSFGLGDDAKTTPGGATNARLHSICPLYSTTALPSLTMEWHDNGASDATAGSSTKYTGVYVDALRLIVNRDPSISRLEVDVIGSGSYSTGSAQVELTTGSPQIGPDIYITNSQWGIYYKSNTLDGATDWDGAIGVPATSLTNFEDMTTGAEITDNVRELRLEWKNSSAPDTLYGSNTARSRTVATYGRRSGTVGITLDNPSLFAATDLAGTRVQWTLQMTAVSDSLIEANFYRAFSIVVPRMEFQWPREDSTDLDIKTLTLPFVLDYDGASAFELGAFAYNANNTYYCQ